MKHPKSPFTPVILLLALVVSCGPTFGQWKVVEHLKQQYVTASQIPSYYSEYRFTRQNKGNSVRFTSANKKTIVDFTNGSQEVFMNGLKFHFSYPVIYKNGQYLISQVDLAKLLHPILRPTSTRRRPFKTVILDPGHGGKDPGTVNKYGQEKSYTLSLAKKLQRRLMTKGFRVVLTRHDDRYLSLQERVSVANQSQDAIFISLHFNAGGAGRAEGIETFSLSPSGVAHYGRGLRQSDLEERAGNTQDSLNIALATAIHGRAIKVLEARDRGIRRARFTVLTGVNHPAILFEGGFMSHYKEAININNDGYLDTMAQTITEGIVRYKLATEKRR